MSRALCGLNKVFSIIFGLLLLAGGVGLILWYAGHLFGVPHTLTVRTLTTLVGYGWWDWAEGIAGVVLALLGLRWLAAYLPSRTSSGLKLSRSDGGGTLDVDLRSVANRAAQSLQDAPGVQSTRGRIGVDRGDATLDVVATIDADADLAPIIAAADNTVGQVAHVLGPDTPVTRVHLKVARSSSPAPRVE